MVPSHSVAKWGLEAFIGKPLGSFFEENGHIGLTAQWFVDLFTYIGIEGARYSDLVKRADGVPGIPVFNCEFHEVILERSFWDLVEVSLPVGIMIIIECNWNGQIWAFRSDVDLNKMSEIFCPKKKSWFGRFMDWREERQRIAHKKKCAKMFFGCDPSRLRD